MRYSLTPLLVLSFIFFDLDLKAQYYLGLSGGGGISGEVFFRAAIPAEAELTQTLSIRSEVVYVQRENRDLLIKLIGDRNYWQATISYLEIPVLAKAHLHLKSLSIYVLAGPKVGYGIRLAANYSEGSVLFEERFDFDEKEIHRLDFGLNLGFGLEKRINKNRKIFIDYRYYLGLSDIDSGAPTNNIYNQGQVFNLGFLLPIDGS